jgi:hypothetical protein
VVCGGGGREEEADVAPCQWSIHGPFVYVGRKGLTGLGLNVYAGRI